MKDCPKCNKQIPDEAMFCAYCGCNIEQEEKSKAKFCIKCGTPFQDGMAFCIKCGNKLVEDKQDDPWAEIDAPKQNDPWADFADYKQPEPQIVEKEVVVEKVVEKVVEPQLSKEEKEEIESYYNHGMSWLDAAALKTLWADRKPYLKYALTAFETAAEKGHVDSMIKAAEVCMDLGRYYDSYKHYEKAMNAGSQLGKYKVASEQFALIMTSKKIAKDKVKGFNMLMELAEENYVHAYYLLGHCYLKGQGVTKDRQQAKYWLEKSVQANVANSKWAKELLDEM